MNFKIGENIRRLRKQRNISQEVLAQYLGVSFQAVSKWENNDNLPDITMIPALASFFGVSTDELFDFDRLKTEEKIQQACWDIADIRYDNPQKAEQMLRDLLKQYPGNEVILNNLLYTMRAPQRCEEVVTICKSILEITKLDDVKYDVLRILAETYHEMGQQNLVKPTLEQIPEIYFSKLELCAELLDGDDALEAAEKQAGLSRDDLLSMLSRLSELHRIAGNKKKADLYANLTKELYALFDIDEGEFSYQLGRRQEWLQESIWSKLAI